MNGTEPPTCFIHSLTPEQLLDMQRRGQEGLTRKRRLDKLSRKRLKDHSRLTDLDTLLGRLFDVLQGDDMPARVEAVRTLLDYFGHVYDRQVTPEKVEFWIKQATKSLERIEQGTSGAEAGAMQDVGSR